MLINDGYPNSYISEKTSMTVRELIEELTKYPHEDRVIIPGYKDGFDDIDSVKTISIKDFEPAAWYYGRYDEAEGNGESAVLLVRQQYMGME